MNGIAGVLSQIQGMLVSEAILGGVTIHGLCFPKVVLVLDERRDRRIARTDGKYSMRGTSGPIRMVFERTNREMHE